MWVFCVMKHPTTQIKSKKSSSNTSSKISAFTNLTLSILFFIEKSDARFNDSLVGSNPITLLLVLIEKYIDIWPVPHHTSKTFLL